MEVTIKSLEACEEAQVGDKTMFAHYVLVEGEGAPDNGKVRVLAQSENKWQPGAVALCEKVKAGFQGPDGEQDWTYCRLKNPEQQQRRGGGGGNSRSFGRSGSGAATQRSSGGASSQPMPTVSFTEAAAAYDDFALEAATATAGTIAALLSNFSEENKPSPDAILAAATTLTSEKARALFYAYVKSFRVAYQAKGE